MVVDLSNVNIPLGVHGKIRGERYLAESRPRSAPYRDQLPGLIERLDLIASGKIDKAALIGGDSEANRRGPNVGEIPASAGCIAENRPGGTHPELFSCIGPCIVVLKRSKDQPIEVETITSVANGKVVLHNQP